MFLIYSVLLLAFALLPVLLTLQNLKLFAKAPQTSNDVSLPTLSVLIPARNEAAGIEATLEAILANEYSGSYEVIVLDDHSEDATPELVAALSAKHPQLKLFAAPELPEGWNGKQHACWQLAQLSENELLLFLDADVILAPAALSRAIAAFLKSEAELEDFGLASGFPRQIMGSWSEHWLVPMMYLLLLGYLPFKQMRVSKSPALGAGCGQLFIARKDKYLDAGGHAGIKVSRHDGLQLPRLFREKAFSTDLFDASDIASVRMYDSFPAMMNGILKNATEGIAREPQIFIFSILLTCGFLLPILSFPHSVYYGWSPSCQVILGIAAALSMLPRFFIAQRLGHPLWHAIINPLAVSLFIALQWLAFLRDKIGFAPTAWRGREN